MLFKDYLIEQILAGKKTATRRLWGKPMVKVGNTYACKKSYYEKRVNCPIIRVTKLHLQELRHMTEADAKAEGFKDLKEFRKAWLAINEYYNPQEPVWVVEFKLIDPGPQTKLDVGI